MDIETADWSVARHRLTRDAGHPAQPEPDLLNVSLRPGDRFLLCTDGISDALDDAYLTRALEAATDPARAAALRTDCVRGDDNATAVLIGVG